MYPMSGVVVSENDVTVDNLWEQGSVFRTECYLSHSKYLNISAGPSETILVASAQDLTYDMAMSKKSFTLSLTRPGTMDASEKDEKTNRVGKSKDVEQVELSPQMWAPLMAEEPIFLHVRKEKRAVGPNAQDV